MANDKKGFLLYADYIHTISKMPKTKQADLFMMILKYVNDQNPETDDLIVSLVWEPIKLQLKRDLVKYETFRTKQKENGKKGGRPTSEIKTQNNPNNPSLLEKTQKSLTVNDNVTVNVNDVVEEPQQPPSRESKLLEMFKRVTSGYDEEFLKVEVEKFINKYPNCIALQSGGLVNSWAARLNKAEQEKWKAASKPSNPIDQEEQRRIAFEKNQKLLQ